MIGNVSFFSQVLNCLPRHIFQRHVKSCGAERCSKGFKSWTQMVAMLFCHLGRAESLREICHGLPGMGGKLSHLGLAEPPARSTLSYANKHRTSELFGEYYYSLLDHFRSRQMLFKGKSFRFKNPVKILDASLISLCHSAYEWAEYRTSKGAAKIHVLLDAMDVMPDFVHVTKGKDHDLVVKDLLNLPGGTIVVFDRGYNDHGFYDDLKFRDVEFVTRMRSNTLYEVIRRNQIPVSIRDRILEDQVIRISGSSYYFRRVVVREADAEEDKEIVLLTSLLKFGPTTISNLYRARWRIEEFFRQIKQNLRIRTFVGTSLNAFKIQIWTAMIALLILSWLRYRSRSGWSFSVFAAMVRLILLSNIKLEEWLKNPTRELLQSESAGQMQFAFR